ncbi:hypothetical protein LGV61_04730 [Desulfurispirillum indicum]|uniref:hypothetical protein n=1 Tax=Desulfurispirillum indicum TaxID=936456 RepID=UPI001CFA93FF|nr:hypothetical protein [Desulfurispirillum indicum]UCZ57587.1 hypothetical protein LGV61_04730 [Desulfurispirillum indicum]
MNRILLLLLLILGTGLPSSAHVITSLEKQPWATQLSTSQKLEIRETISTVMGSAQPPGPTQRQRFWELLGSMPPAEFQQFARDVIQIHLRHQLLWTRDALITARSGVARKSPERETLEQAMMRQGIFSRWQVEQMDTALTQFAAGEATRLPGLIPLEAATLEQTLDNLEKAEEHLATLFSRPLDMPADSALTHFTTRAFQATIQSRQGLLDVQTALKIHFASRNPATTMQELRTVQNHIESTARDVIFTQRAESVETPQGKERMLRQLARDINALIHSGRIERVELQSWHIRAP